MFELVYDYFVVLANTRVVFVVQLVWLAALVPVVFAGAQLAGPAGAGAAQFAVAALVVAPIYLYELRRAGIGAGALAARLATPVLASLVVAGCAVLASLFIPIDVLALLAAGTVAMGAVALLLYRMRGVLKSLRNVGEPVEAPVAVPV
jgi:PST family polysaccharide transporter